MTEYVPRDITPRIVRAMQNLPVVVISGLRQTGKSTLLQSEEQLSAGRTYYTLDDLSTLAAARANPESLLRSPVTIDEAQRCPELFLAVKKTVDANRHPGYVLLSGSANLALLSHVSETLAGRALYVTLHPMCRREIQQASAQPPLLFRWLTEKVMPSGTAEPVTEEEIIRGGLPPVCLSTSDDFGDWFAGYVQTYVERDVRQLSNVLDLVAFQTFVRLVAFRTAGVLSISDLARDAGLSVTTASRYLRLLEASFLTRPLPPYLRNPSARLIKSPKLFMTDSGLASYLAGIREFSFARYEPYYGRLFETYVFQNLAALLEAHLPEARLYYWHEQGRYEVDFVVEYHDRVIAIEAKAATRWVESDFASLEAFRRRAPQCDALVLASNGTHAFDLGNNRYVLPVGHLLS